LCCAFQVDAARNLIYVRGQVPGHKGNFVKISDAVLKTFAQQPPRPVPTFLDALPLEPLLAPKPEKSPFDYRE
jgi:large subunit ribosomal protein L3